MAEKRTLNLKDKQRGSGGAKATSDKKAISAPAKKSVKKPPAKQEIMARKSKLDLLDEEDDEDGEDDEILSEMENAGKGNTPILFIVAGILVVLVVVVGFLLLSGRKRPADEPNIPSSQPTTSQGDASSSVQDPLTDLGTQDFTQDTNWTSSSEMVNPDLYTEDIHGLTTRVDYTVKSINYIADFVSYEKRRGTWGGGLELYWLDATYQGNKYVVQIPFQYYKELSETGIIPVKMEVLSIAGSTEGQTLNVISYMMLDEETLKDILKQQSKTR